MFDIFEIIEFKKIISMVLALAIIQILSRVIARRFNTHTGLLISSFIGGLISSTALTASLARKTKSMSLEHVQIESIAFLGATLAMLIQGLFLVIAGVDEFPKQVFIVFMVPIVITVILIFIRYKKTESIEMVSQKKLSISNYLSSIFKLTFFIIGVIAISNLLKDYFGQRGLEYLTFMVSLFEIHGSIIANAQLFSLNSISINEFSFLIGLSVIASYISKVFMILLIGHSYLKKKVVVWVFILLTSVFITLKLVALYES